MSVMSQMDGKAASQLLYQLCGGAEVTIENINSIYYGNLHRKSLSGQ